MRRGGMEDEPVTFCYLFNIKDGKRYLAPEKRIEIW